MTDLSPPGAEAALLDCIAKSVECEPERCKPDRCFCRRQVEAVAKQFRLRRRKPVDDGVWTAGMDAKLMEMRAAVDPGTGKAIHTTDSLAEALGVSRWAVKRRVRRLSLPPRRDWAPTRPRNRSGGRRQPADISGSGPV